jgi:hypothetical protein
MSPVSRGFRHLHRATPGQEDRVPPGQYVTDGLPVLSASPTPHTPLENWTFSITQDGQAKKSWTWRDFQALPAETVTADIHCVTRWSKLDTVWRGVPVDTLLDQVQHDARYVMAFCDGGYSTNLPIEDVTGGKAWVAWPSHRAGQYLDVRLTAEDGYTAERGVLDRLGQLPRVPSMQPAAPLCTTAELARTTRVPRPVVSSPSRYGAPAALGAHHRDRHPRGHRHLEAALGTLAAAGVAKAQADPMTA